MADNGREYRRLGELIKPHWFALTLAVLCMMAIAGTTAAIAWLVKPILDDVFLAAGQNKEHAARMVIILPLVFLAVQTIKGAATYGQEVLMGRVGQEVVASLRERLYNHLQILSLKFYDFSATGTIIARITSDVMRIQEAVSSAVAGGFRDVVTIIALVAVILFRDWQLALLAVVVFPLAIGPFVWLGQKVRRYSTRSQEVNAELANQLQETCHGARVIKAFNAENRRIERFNAASEKFYRLTMKEVRVRAMSSPLMEVVGGIGLAMVLGYGGLLVLEAKTTPGTFFSFMAALVLLYDPAKKIVRTYAAIQNGLAALTRVYQVLDTPADITDRPGAIEMPPFAREISFEGVHFSYGREPVLTGVDIKAPAGKILAIAGASGGGKTSLVNLLPRFYDPHQGSVKIDGRDIREFSQTSLRSRIALVTQQTVLFNESVRANIAYGKPGATEHQIIAAAKAAYAHDFIMAMPQGYQTVIGESGGLLSGGQRQRLAIARALLKDAPILILDEATSALDTTSEYYVQKAINNLMLGRTTLVIAHRLSTIHHAHKIVVISNGRIAESGGHEDLMAQNGEYARLYRMQFSETTDQDGIRAGAGD